MTKQEYIKKESESYSEGVRMTVEHSSWYHQKTEPFKSGLAKGLEIAENILDFAVNKYFSVERLDGKTYWAKSGETKSIQYLTTSQLLEIYLTENEKK